MFIIFLLKNLYIFFFKIIAIYNTLTNLILKKKKYYIYQFIFLLIFIFLQIQLFVKQMILIIRELRINI